MAEKGKKEVKTLCAECEKDVTLTLDEDGDYIGKCENCSLDMGRIMTRRRYDSAYSKQVEREESAKKDAEKKNKKTGW